MNIQDQIKNYISTEPEPKRNALHDDKNKIDTSKLAPVKASIKKATVYKGDSKTFLGTAYINDFIAKATFTHQPHHSQKTLRKTKQDFRFL